MPECSHDEHVHWTYQEPTPELALYDQLWNNFAKDYEQKWSSATPGASKDDIYVYAPSKLTANALGRLMGREFEGLEMGMRRIQRQ